MEHDGVNPETLLILGDASEQRLPGSGDADQAAWLRAGTDEGRGLPAVGVYASGLPPVARRHAAANTGSGRGLGSPGGSSPRSSAVRQPVVLGIDEAADGE